MIKCLVFRDHGAENGGMIKAFQFMDRNATHIVVCSVRGNIIVVFRALL